MKEQKFTLDEIKEAFRRLGDRVAAKGTDADCMWAIHHAIEDGIRILIGELASESNAPDEDGLRLGVREARTVEAFDAAVVRLGTFDGREQVMKARNEIDSAWRPSLAGNEAMLAALETYGEKRAGALGRGAARAEADTFALMEARRVYQRATNG